MRSGSSQEASHRTIAGRSEYGLAEDALDLGEAAQDAVLDLQDPLRLGDGHARERRRHVEVRALVERRHELGAEPEVDRNGRCDDGDGEHERERPVPQDEAARRLVDREQHAADRMALLRVVAPDGDRVGHGGERARAKAPRLHAREQHAHGRIERDREQRRDRHREVLRVRERLEETPFLVDQREDRQERDRDHQQREEDRRTHLLEGA
jgi:hypothetical protein